MIPIAFLIALDGIALAILNWKVCIAVPIDPGLINIYVPATKLGFDGFTKGGVTEYVYLKITANTNKMKLRIILFIFLL